MYKVKNSQTQLYLKIMGETPVWISRREDASCFIFNVLTLNEIKKTLHEFFDDSSVINITNLKFIPLF